MSRAPIGKHGRDHRPPGTLGPDDPGGHDPFAGVPVYDNGTWVTTEGGLDFEDTDTVTWEVVDDPLNFRTIIKADAVSGGGGGSGSFPGGAVQTVSHIGIGTTRTDGASSASTLNVFANKPTSLAVGDLLIVLLNSYQTASPSGDITLATIPAGWGTIYNYDLVAQDDGGNAGYKSVRAAFWRFVDGTESSPMGTWVLHNSVTGGFTGYTVCQAFRNTASSGQLGEFKSLQTSVTGSSPWASAAPAVSPVPSGSLSLLLGTCPALPPSVTWTFPSGYSTATLNGAATDVATFLGWKLNGDGSALAVSAAGFSALGTNHRFAELAQLIVYPALV